MAQPGAFERKWLVLAAVGASILLTTIDGTIVNVALPTLEREFDTSLARVQWVPLAYLLTLSTLLLGMGRLGDMYGPKPVFMIGLVIFTAGSVLCGLAPSINWLIGFRVLQAIGAAINQALGIAIITACFPATERGKALGISGTLVSIGIVLGPALGGIIIDSLSWRWIFFVNLPIGMAGLALTWRYLLHEPPQDIERFDLPGAGVLFAALLVLLAALTMAQQRGFGEVLILTMFGVTVLLVLVFVLIERRAPHPMIDLTIFDNSLFTINIITSLMVFMAVAGVFVLLPFYLSNMLDYGPREVGFLIAVVSILLGVSAPVAGALSDRFGTRVIATIGLAVLAIGYLAMSRLGADTPAWAYVLAVLPFGVGMGVFQSPNNSAVMGAVPASRLGVASGLLAITRNFGQTAGIALLTALWATRVGEHAGYVPAGGATSAPLAAQIAGLQDAFRMIALFVGSACLLSLYSVWQAKASVRPARS